MKSAAFGAGFDPTKNQSAIAETNRRERRVEIEASVRELNRTWGWRTWGLRL
jgi:hypothetical protein